MSDVADFFSSSAAYVRECFSTVSASDGKTSYERLSRETNIKGDTDRHWRPCVLENVVYDNDVRVDKKTQEKYCQRGFDKLIAKICVI